MTNVPQDSITCQGLNYELEFRAAREAVDYAGRWAWQVYDKVEKALGHEQAAETAMPSRLN